MQEREIKTNNLLTLDCTVSQDITGLPIIGGFLDSSAVLHSCAIAPIDSFHFSVILDTSLYSLGRGFFDLKVGNISSDTIAFMVTKNIA